MSFHSLLNAVVVVVVVVVQQIYAGFVSSVRSSLVFVHFLNRFTGVVPIHNIADSFVEDASQVVQAGRTVKAKLVELPSEEDKKVSRLLGHTLLPR